MEMERKSLSKKKYWARFEKNGGPNPVSLLNVGVYLGAPWGLNIDQGSDRRLSRKAMVTEAAVLATHRLPASETLHCQ